MNFRNAIDFLDREYTRREFGLATTFVYARDIHDKRIAEPDWTANPRWP